MINNVPGHKQGHFHNKVHLARKLNWRLANNILPYTSFVIFLLKLCYELGNVIKML